MNIVSDFVEIRASDAAEARGKGANLAELVAARLLVPPGFRVARRAGITSSLCGQALSRNVAFAEFLVRLGITSISVDPAVAAVTRRFVAAAEHRIVLEGALAT